ncbi:F0F1 ATP synthase subunit delta [Chlorobaculum sp. 24CR]|uniref:ATP synthase F1 subunit delta n=1 Tax=Chlorobaculum sp. 24CR TaxID=2508878 RepID=UPI00100A693A|nr:ATP synthase F1 subunit delta [Chlorobaculum sp. 24CR]RXK87747.1 F0F1 ATP synthase subunit delta [Chlorobaculum sp. 24CR]
MSSAIAGRRYAVALLEVAVEAGFLERVTEDLRKIQEVIAGSHELVLALKSPLINVDLKSKILEEIFKNEVGEKTMLFLKLLAHKKRAGLLVGVVNEFNALIDERNGVINADVTSAVKLGDDQAKELVNSLSARTGKKIRARMLLDEKLIGGVAVKIGDTIIDGSISHQLEMLRHSLVAEPA